MAQIINVSTSDLNISLTQAVPANNTNVTTGILDLQAIAANSDAWQLGLISVAFPAMPENTGTGITVALQAAAASLTNSQPAPILPVPGAFVTPQTAQTMTLTGVAAIGTTATKGYFNLALDPNGSTYQFYQFVITTPNGTVTTGENIVIAWEPRA